MLQKRARSEIEDSSTSSSLVTSTSCSRIIAHIDLDCFYVQVERRLNGDLIGKPVAVVQYNPFGEFKPVAAAENRINISQGSIIAVSYEARAKGVKRIMRGFEAKVACPDIILVQVPTARGKADLQIYRDASASVIQTLSKRFKDITVERSSIDEVYLDVTAGAGTLLNSFATEPEFQSKIRDPLSNLIKIAGEDKNEINLSKREISVGHSGSMPDKATHSEDSSLLERDSSPHEWFTRSSFQWSLEDKLLLCGSFIVEQLRSDVFTELGLTCSAGVANNKMLAKIASAMHKPNKQTIVPMSTVLPLILSLPISRVPGFAGKLGSMIEEAGDIKTFADAAKLSRDQLLTRFGEEIASKILSASHGIDDDPVKARALPISIGCGKSFASKNMIPPAGVNDGKVLHWLRELSLELFERCNNDEDTNARKAQQLTVSVTILPSKEIISSTGNDQAASMQVQNIWGNGFQLSKLAPMPKTADLLCQTALSLVKKSIASSNKTSGQLNWHITYISMVATSFIPIVDGAQSIASYFRMGSTSFGSNSDMIDAHTSNLMKTASANDAKINSNSNAEKFSGIRSFLVQKEDPVPVTGNQSHASLDNDSIPERHVSEEYDNYNNHQSISIDSTSRSLLPSNNFSIASYFKPQSSLFAESEKATVPSGDYQEMQSNKNNSDTKAKSISSYFVPKSSADICSNQQPYNKLLKNSDDYLNQNLPVLEYQSIVDLISDGDEDDNFAVKFETNDKNIDKIKSKDENRSLNQGSNRFSSTRERFADSKRGAIGITSYMQQQPSSSSSKGSKESIISSKDFLPESMMDLDQEVLNSLPENIRCEVLSSLQRTKVRK